MKGDRSFDLVVRWQPPFRTSLDAIRQIRLPLPSGSGYVPLAQVAQIKEAQGASFVYRENLERYVTLRFSVRGPLAIVVIGGAIAIALITRLLQPILIYLCHRRLRLADRPAAEG